MNCTDAIVADVAFEPSGDWSITTEVHKVGDYDLDPQVCFGGLLLQWCKEAVCIHGDQSKPNV